VWLGVEIFLAALIGFLIIVLSWSHNVTFDMTPTHEHTLSDQSQRTARRLGEDVRITLFYNSQEQGRVREMKDLLRRFTDQSSHLTFRMLDLDRSPLLANQYGIVNYNTAVVEGSGRQLLVRDLSEDELTTALIKLIEGGQRVVVFAVGHGENDPKNPDPGRVTVRRLNRVEYRNTIRDLMGIDFNSEVEFPPDDSGYGFDNIGDVLTVSPMLLEKYVTAAGMIVAEAVPTVPRVVAEQTIAGNRFRRDAADAGGDKPRGNRKDGPLSLSYYEPATASCSFTAEHAGHFQLALELARGSAWGFVEAIQCSESVRGSSPSRAAASSSSPSTRSSCWPAGRTPP
jgi:hypothetical protein